MIKGCKGQMTVPDTEKIKEFIGENAEVFKAVCERDFVFCEFDIYEATYNKTNVIGIDFDIRDHTVKDVNKAVTRFRKEFFNHFGAKPKVVFKASYEKIGGINV